MSPGRRSGWRRAGRTAGWRAALQDAGADVTPPFSGDWSARSGYQAGQVLAQIPDARAIFVANDHMALGVLRALHDRGRRVPEEVAVVGFDDTPESAYFIPPLTTVRQDFQRVGRAAVQLLVGQLSRGQKQARTGRDRPRARVPAIEPVRSLPPLNPRSAVSFPRSSTRSAPSPLATPPRLLAPEPTGLTTALKIEAKTS